MRSLFGLIPLVGGVLAATPSDNIGKSYNLYHKLGNESKMTSRGTIKIAPSEDADGGLVATFDPDSSARLDSVAFDGMVESGALYTIVVLESGGGDDAVALPSASPYPPSNARYVSASVPGCSLRRSNLREEIGLSVSPTGKLLSVSYRPIISPLAPKTCRTLKPLSEKPEAIFARRGEDEDGGGKDGGVATMPFKTTVSFDSHKPMMAIPTILPQQRPPPGLKWYRRNAKNNPNPLLGGSNVQREGGGGGIPGIDDETPTGFKSSFLYRYWYIILPLAIMGLFGGVEEEESSQPRGGAAGGGAGASAAGAVAAGGASHQAKQRRGKRD